MKPLTSVSPRLVLVVSTLIALAASTAKAANDFWAGVSGSSASTNWTDPANWTFSGQSSPQTYFNQVEFIGVGASPNNNTAVNNVLDATTGISQMPIWELDYAVTNGNYTTLIAPGVTMQTGAGNGFLKVGADVLHTGSPAPADAVETITILGAGGTLIMNPNNNNGLLVGQGSVSPNDTHNVTLDMSGLDNFVMNPPSGGNSYIYLASSSAARANGVLYLAKTNNIVLGAGIQICNQSSSSNSLPVIMYLGINNSITTGTSGNFNIGQTGVSTNGCIVEFNPVFLGGANPPTAVLNSAATGGRIPGLFVCNTSQGFPSYALCDLSGGSINALVNNLAVGLSSSGHGSATGVLTFDMGTINASTSSVGRQQSSGGGIAVGTVNINSNSTYGASATLTVGGTLSLGVVTGTLTPGSAGTININGGTLSVGTIATGGGGASTINCSKGNITIGTTAGTAAAPISAVSLTNSSLTFAANPNVTNAFVSSLVTGGSGNVINISSVPPSPTYPEIVHLIQYSSIGGAGYNFTAGTLPALASGYISNDIANSSIDLVLTTGPLALSWNGSINGNWDSSTANWTGGTGVYSDGNFVQFLDGASANNVNLTTTLLPGGITISNSALNYTFSGSGNLAGSYSLIKQGTNVLVLDNSSSNIYSGGTTISAGAIQIGNSDANGNLPGNITDNGLVIFDRNDGSLTLNNAISGTGGLVHAGGGTLQLSGGNTFTGLVLVTNGSTLQLGSSAALGGGTSPAVIAGGCTLDFNGLGTLKTIMVSGTGANGNGALTDTGGAVYSGLSTNIILTGDTTFNYPVRWDLGSASPGSVLQTDGQARNLTLNSSSGYFQWQNLSVLAPLANITLAAGTLGVVGSTTFGDPNATLALEGGTTLQFYGPNVFVNKNVDFQANATIQVSSGNNRMNGAMTLEPGYCEFNIGGGTSLTLSNVLSGSGVFYQLTGTGTTTLWGNSPSFTGGILLNAGNVVLNGLIGSGITSSFAGTEISGNGTANGLVDVSGGLNPGSIGGAGTFNAAGGLTLEVGATVTMDLAPANSVGGGTNDLIAVTGDLTVNGNNININPLTGVLTNGTYVLMTYSGNLNGFFGTASTITSSRYNFTIDTSIPHQVNLIVAGVPDVLAWNNGSGDGQWNVQASQNWTNLTRNVEDQFFAADMVLLDNRGAQGPNPLTALTIPSGTVVTPSVITNNSTTNYTISGAGKISGPANIVKLGPSTLTMTLTNDFTGNLTIGTGTVQLNGVTAAAGATNGTLVISNGATLAVNLNGSYPTGDAGFGNKPIVVSGTGANGNGAIQFSGGPLYNDGSTLGLGQYITLAGDTTFSAAGRFDWGYPGAGTTLSTRGSNYNLTVSAGSGYSQWYDIGIDTNLGNIDLYTTAGSQTMRIQALGVSLGNPTNILTLHSNILFNVQHGDTTAGDNGYAKIVHILPTATWQYQPNGGAGDYRLATAFVLETNAGLYFFNGTGGSGSGTVINGTVQLNDLAHLQIGDSTVTFSNVISGPGGFYWDNYNNNMVFTATNTYQGPTILGSGMVLALVGNGSISSSTNISLGTSAVLDVSGRSDQTLTLALGQMLQGNGAIKGGLLVPGGAVLAPGGVGTIGTLSVTNSINLSGILFMDINGTNLDQLNCTNGMTFGGDLVVSNLGPAFTAGQSFKLFNAGSYTGTFSLITPAPGPGLSWDQSALNTGIIKVIGGAVKPTISHISISGGNVVLSGTNNSGQPGNYSVLTSTNINVPLSNWTVLTNSTFDSNGNFNSTNAVGTNRNQFYILQVP